jgi:hypothetical protein
MEDIFNLIQIGQEEEFKHKITEKDIDKYSSSFIQYFARLYSFVPASLNVIEQNFRTISNISNITKRKKISFNKINKFDSEFNVFMDDFYKINSDIITCKRNKDFFYQR